MERERLTRVEEKLDALRDLLERHLEAQEEESKILFATEKRITILEATVGGIWKTVAVLGTVSAVLGAVFAWLVEHPPFFNPSSQQQKESIQSKEKSP